MGSVWTESTGGVHFKSLTGSTKTDVLVIGGGITGVLCAYMLKRAGIDCVLAEAKEICSGITQNTTAKITLQHGLVYEKLIKQFGADKARLYLKAQREANKEYARLCSNIDCDYEKKDSYVFSVCDRKKIEKEVYALNGLGEKAEMCYTKTLPFEAAAARVGDQAQFNPLKFVYAIANELPIYQNTKVLALMPQKAITDGGEISCDKIIVATHFPILNKHGGYFLKMYQHRSYVIALSGCDPLDGMYVDEDKKGLSFRNWRDLLLLGGGSHRTGKQGGGYTELLEFAKKHYPSAKIVGKWATQDCMTLDSVPYIGQYSKHTPSLFAATGFNKWGMTSAMVSALLLKDLVQGKPNPYAHVFSPSRSMLRPQLAANMLESLWGFVTPTVPRCPHMGCALKYNRMEHSWDCPCHGSRFSQNGQLIDNPATDDKRLG